MKYVRENHKVDVKSQQPYFEMVQKNRQISNLHRILPFSGRLMKKKMKNLDCNGKFLRFDTNVKGEGQELTNHQSSIFLDQEKKTRVIHEKCSRET